MERLLIKLENLPEDESREMTGELSPEFFDLSGKDVKPAGPLSYDLSVQRFENELFVSGKISAPFEFSCVRTLEPFVKTISIDDFSTSIEIGEQYVVDITDEVREEVILAFPAYPKCDMADVPMPCEINSLYLGIDKHPEEELNTSRTDGTSGVWDALDSLQQNSK